MHNRDEKNLSISHHFYLLHLPAQNCFGSIEKFYFKRMSFSLLLYFPFFSAQHI